MTVKELKQKLTEYPDNMEVFIAPRVSEFYYGLLNTVRSKEINFTEEPGEEVLGRDTVVILDEE